MLEIKRNSHIPETRPLDETRARDGELWQHYSREKRLAKASPEVRALYEENAVRRGGILRSLTDTRPKTILFLSIVAMCIIVLFMTHLAPAGGQRALAGNTVSASAMRYGPDTFIVLKKTLRAKETAYTGVVSVVVYPEDGKKAGQALDARQVFWTAEKEEEFRFTAPFTSPRLFLHIQAGAHMARLSVKTQ